MNKLTPLVLALAILLGAALMAPAQQDNNAGQAAPADNTKVNQRDRDQSQPTADQQKENKPDREIAKEIRQSIMNDKSLSTYAHNVKIITREGKVTLKGPVRSEEEKDKVAAAASTVAGEGNVTNEITVAPKS
jgi:hyperosmotically inducible periplasmic protein